MEKEREREKEGEKLQHRGCIVYDALGRLQQPYWIPLAAVDQNYKAEHALGPRMLQHPYVLPSCMLCSLSDINKPSLYV